MFFVMPRGLDMQLPGFLTLRRKRTKNYDNCNQCIHLFITHDSRRRWDAENLASNHQKFLIKKLWQQLA